MRLLEKIATWCDRFTPFVALEAPDVLLLDVTGAAHLFGGERAMLDTLRASLKKQKLAVRAALAGTAMAARALARECDGAIAAPGEESAMVASLPIDALLLDPHVTHAFRRAGLKTVGQVASRTRAELVGRFGREVASTIDRALGRGEKPISPRLPLPDYMAEHRFADPVTNQEVVAATLQQLAGSIAHILEERSEGARALEAAFFRADGAVFRLGIETGRPTRDPKIVERLFREKLSSLADPLDPGFGFDLIRLSVPHAERTNPEAITFEASVQDDDEIAFLVDRLAARFGAERVISFLANDTHIPEAAAVAVPAQHRHDSKTPWEADPREAARRRDVPCGCSIAPSPSKRSRKFRTDRLCVSAGGARCTKWRWRKGRSASPWNGGAISPRCPRAIISAWRTSRAAASGSIARGSMGARRTNQNGSCTACLREEISTVYGRNFPCSALFFDMGFGADMRLRPMVQGFLARPPWAVFSTPLLMALIAGEA